MVAESSVSATMPAHNTAAAVDFLLALIPSGRVALCAIVPDGAIAGRTFMFPEGAAAARTWIEPWQGVANLYWTLNEPKAPESQVGRAGRALEADIVNIRGVAVDIDPDRDEETRPGGVDRERARLAALAIEMRGHWVGHPAAIVNSGSGLQAVWMLSEPIPVTPGAKLDAVAQARGLAKAYGSDPVHSLEHLFRIPFTINLPTATKRARGRGVCSSSVIHLDPSLPWSLGTLRLLASPIHEAERPASPASAAEFEEAMAYVGARDDLPADLTGRVALAPSLRGLLAPDREWPDRSGQDFAIAAACVEAGIVDPLEIGTVVAAYGSEKVEQRGAGYLAGTVARALAKARSPQSYFEAVSEPAPIGAPSGILAVSGRIDPASIPTRRWLVHPRLPIGTATLCVGEPAISKSTFALRDALIVATGDERILRGAEGIGPERLHRTGPALVYNAEDDLSEMQRRLAAAQQHHGIETMRHPVHLWSGVDKALVLARRSDGKGPLVPCPGELEAAIQSTGAVLVILDPLISLQTGGEENSTEDMDVLMATVAGVAARTGASIIVVQHTAKSTRGAAGDMGAGRGAFSIVAKARSMFTLCAVTAEEAKAWGVAERDVIRLDYGKSSYGKRLAVPQLFERRSVSVGNGGMVALGSAGDLFRMSAEDSLLLSGDTAPVLEFIGEGRPTQEKSETAAPKIEAKRMGVASAVLQAIGGPGSASLNEARERITSSLNAAGITAATARSTIFDLVTAHLVDGVTVPHLGQPVKISMRKNGLGKTAAWVIVAEAISNGSAQALPELPENASSASSGSLK